MLVAATTVLSETSPRIRDFRWQTWPADAVTQTFITQKGSDAGLKSVTGAIVRQPMLAGEPVTRLKVDQAGRRRRSRGDSAERNARSLDAHQGRNGCRPADPPQRSCRRHPDAPHHGGNQADQEQHVSDTLFRNVRVLAIGQQIETKEGNKAAEGGANTATLELAPARPSCSLTPTRWARSACRCVSIAATPARATTVSDVDPFANDTSAAARCAMLQYGVPIVERTA